jgi:hypothetical protein
MTSFGGAALTIVSAKLIELPAFCVQCGEPTSKTTTVHVDTHQSPLLILAMLLGPFGEIARLALESGHGPKTAKLPYCKTCSRPRNRIAWQAAVLFLPIFALLFAFTSQFAAGLPFWEIGAAVLLTLASLAWGIYCCAKYQNYIPVKISREKKGIYRYEFRSGIYIALAQRAGFSHADLTQPLPPRPFPEPLDFTK